LTSPGPRAEHPLVRFKFGLLIGALVQAGCSFIFVEGPPARHREMPYFACSTSNAPPVLDTVVGGLAAMSATAPAANTESSARISQAVMAAALAASAIYGYTQVSRCDDAYLELADRMYVPRFTPQPALPAPTPDPVPQP
jgi:hypothetical protein